MDLRLRFLDISTQDSINILLLSDGDRRAIKCRALAKLQITVSHDQTPLQAWILAMCALNDLPATLPSVAIGEAARDLCPTWLYFLA